MAVYPPDLRRVIKPTEQEFNTFPLPAVTAIDTTIFFNDGRNPEAGFGSGIVISPNYVLSAAHNFYPPDEAKKGKGKNQDEIRVSNSRNQLRLNSREIGHPDDIGDLDVNVRAGRNGDIFYLTNWKNTLSTKDDIALVKTVNNALISPSPSVGLIAFVNPGTAKNYKIQTAGYPVDNVSSNIPGNSGQKTRDLVLAPGSFDLVGRIHKTLGREMLYSYDIDTFTGQSGSPVWHTLEGDLPRVLGVHSSGNPPRNSGTLIDKNIYDRIIQETKDDSGIIIGNDLPENAIIGTDPSFIPIDTPFSTNGDDEIIGTYRRERIIGNGGDDNLDGGGADDRLEGGEGNDILDGGAGNDLAIFSDNFENYDYSISEDEEIITINHIDGTQTDETDTLRNIEWGQFNGEQEDTGTLVASSSLFGIPIATAPRRVIPLPLTDGVETTEYIEVQSTIANPNPNDPPTPPTISLTAPVAMLDGDVDYTLNILPYEPDTEYNVVYVIDTSISIDAVELQTIKDAYTDLTNFYINEGIAENINFGVVSFDSSGRFHTGSSGGRNLTADEAITALQDLTIDTRIGTRYFDGLNQADQF